ncbi:MAG: patatin-like phospholipase family protein [Candidatus Saccharibacteria bacterium]|nr:patatin-like phospholipase family protein [Moraxellaceae bacterium]
MSKMKSTTPCNMTGLVLTAGGARGAYQAGVLKRVSEIPAFAGKPSPFKIITGASAGAINGATIAANSGNFLEGAKLLTKLWGNLDASHVFRFDSLSLAQTGAQAALDFAFGGLFGAGRLKSFLDAEPLRHLLESSLDLAGIDQSIKAGHLYAIGVTTTGYHSGKAFTFVQGQLGHALWNKSRRVALRTHLSIDHILASAAIPLVFPPVALKTGDSVAYFGDGAMRLTTPLSPAIRLGAERLFAIGVRCQESADSLLRSELATHDDYVTQLQRPPLSQICGTLMNAIFLDHLDADLDHLKRMNNFVSAYQELEKKIPDQQHLVMPEPMRIVTPMVISPSADIAIIAKTLEHRMPRSIRYLMDGLGQPDAQSADLMSFLLFDSAFTRELIQLGYHDAGLRIDEIEHFLFENM